MDNIHLVHVFIVVKLSKPKKQKQKKTKSLHTLSPSNIISMVVVDSFIHQCLSAQQNGLVSQKQVKKRNKKSNN